MEERGGVKTEIGWKTPLGNRSNKSHMEVEGNRTTRNTSKPAQTADGTDRQTYRQTDIFFIVVLGLWEANIQQDSMTYIKIRPPII